MRWHGCGRGGPGSSLRTGCRQFEMRTASWLWTRVASSSREAMIAGGTVNVSGKVGGKIRAAGGNLALNAPVEQDVVVTGGNVNIGSGGTIGRDLVIAGGMATVSAPVARRVTMAAGDLTLRGRVGGDVRGRVDRLRLDGAQIGGNLDYTSANPVVLANGAHVAGTTTRQ